MLKENFYSSNNQKRALEVNVNLKNVLQKIAEEEKNWEKHSVDDFRTYCPWLFEYIIMSMAV